MRNLITREEAVAIVGEQLVSAAELAPTEYDNNASTGWYETWSQVKGEGVTVQAVYLQDAELVMAVADLCDLQWDIAGYRLV